MPMATVGGVDWFYTDQEGDAPTVLLVHGWTCDSHDWMWQLPALAERFRVIAVDLPGHGRSTGVPGDWGPSGLAHDLAALLEQRSVGPVVAVGHSYGAAISLALAVEHPAMVGGLVAVDPAFGFDDTEVRQMADLAAAMQAHADPALVAAAIAALDRPSTPPSLRCWHERRALGTPIATAVGMGSALALAAASFHATAPDSYLARRPCAMLTICADASRARGAEICSHPGDDVVVWEQVGHWLHQERPKDTNALVGAWIAAHATKV